MVCAFPITPRLSKTAGDKVVIKYQLSHLSPLISNLFFFFKWSYHDFSCSLLFVCLFVCFLQCCSPWGYSYLRVTYMCLQHLQTWGLSVTRHTKNRGSFDGKYKVRKMGVIYLKIMSFVQK